MQKILAYRLAFFADEFAYFPLHRMIRGTEGKRAEVPLSRTCDGVGERAARIYVSLRYEFKKVTSSLEGGQNRI